MKKIKSTEEILNDLKRKQNKVESNFEFNGLFEEMEPETEWWGMPEFENVNITPQYKVNVNLLTTEDLFEFAKKLGIKITKDTNSIWYPPQERLVGGAYVYDGPKSNSKYPICIPSKGRADCQTTGKALDEMGTEYKFFVEETEYKEYCKYLGEQRVVKLPFHDLGQGSIPVRNFIWDWAKEQGYKRHWTVDDNIRAFGRTNHTRRLTVKGGQFFRAMEDFVDRYENIAMAGPHHIGFISIGWGDVKPYTLNSRVYSCILLDTTLDYRWRGRYNEDTDLSLRLLKDGWCTLLFNALFMNKGATHGGVKSHGAMKGGNTDNVYNSGDYRLAFAESLKEQHPDVVDIVWKYNRWHHQVNYSKFKNNKLILKKGITPTSVTNEYGMELVYKGK